MNASASIHKFFERNKIPFAPHDNIFPSKVNREEIIAPKFLPMFIKAFPKFPTAFAPCFKTFLALTAIVAIIPATEIETADNLKRFSFAHF